MSSFFTYPQNGVGTCSPYLFGHTLDHTLIDKVVLEEVILEAGVLESILLD